jgi:hypothetical protein
MIRTENKTTGIFDSVRKTSTSSRIPIAIRPFHTVLKRDDQAPSVAYPSVRSWLVLSAFGNRIRRIKHVRARTDRPYGVTRTPYTVPRTRSLPSPSSTGLSPFLLKYFYCAFFSFFIFLFSPTCARWHIVVTACTGIRRYDLTCSKVFTGRSESTWHRFRRIARARCKNVIVRERK